MERNAKARTIPSVRLPFDWTANQHIPYFLHLVLWLVEEGCFLDRGDATREHDCLYGSVLYRLQIYGLQVCMYGSR